MDFKELDMYLKELDSEEIVLKKLIEENQEKLLEEEVIKLYSTDTTEKDWIINSKRLMSDKENFAIHKHKRFVTFKEHKHDYLELVYMYSGSVKQKINGEDVDINEGEICLLDLNLYHSIQAASESDIAVNIIMKKQFFDGIFMSFLSDNDIISDFIIKAFYDKKESNNFLIFHCRDNDEIQYIMKKLLCEYFSKRTASETAIHAYILLLFTELLRDYKENMEQSNIKNLNRTIISEVKKYLSQNYKNVTLAEIAEYFHFHPDYLSKMIRSSSGVSFTDLLQDIRLREACLLLETTDMPISDITYEVGYSNLSYFHKLFKKIYGVTPLEYRKIYKR